MRSLIVGLSALTALGCGASAQEVRLQKLEGQLAELQNDNAGLREANLKLETANAQLQAGAKVTRREEPTTAQLPVPTPMAPAPGLPFAGSELGYAATLVHGQPVAYQCFLGDNPGLAPGNWIEVKNHNPEWFLYLTVDDAPLIVMRPVGNGRWAPLYAGRSDRTVLPPTRSCHFRAPARLTPGGRLREYVFRADAFDQAMGSIPGQATVLEPVPSAHLRRPWVQTLSNQHVTAVGFISDQFN